MAPSPGVLAYNRKVIQELLNAETQRRKKGVSSVQLLKKVLHDSFEYLLTRPDLPIPEQINKVERIHRYYRGKFNH